MATAREHLESIIPRCAELQNWSDSDLNFNEQLLKEADELLDSCMTTAQVQAEEAAMATHVKKPKPPRAEYM